MQDTQGCYGISHKNDRSEAIISTPNGHGSTYTAIRVFTAIALRSGSDITPIVNDTVYGSAFKINADGLYAFDYMGEARTSVATAAFGLVKNPTPSQSADNVVNMLFSGALIGWAEEQTTNRQQSFSCMTWCRAGDIIRPITDGTPNTTAANCAVRAIKVV